MRNIIVIPSLLRDRRDRHLVTVHSTHNHAMAKSDVFQQISHRDNGPLSTMSDRLDGRVVIVTGARQGIGKVYSKAIAAQGARVVICDLVDPIELADEIRAYGSEAMSCAADVTSASAVREMVERAKKQFGRIDALVNNAGLFTTLKPRPFEDIDSDEWDRVMAVNVRGSFECARAVAPLMRQQKYGKIVNIASGTVFKGSTGLMHYVASKGAVIAMTRSMARELGPDNICVNVIAPGNTPPESTVVTERGAATIATRALRRVETPDDIVGAVIFFCSAESDFITGQTLIVDGGAVFN
jgi:NAD(P)-dependent dehydrogenase (short-subunit alcohol dehydrogenase family)